MYIPRSHQACGSVHEGAGKGSPVPSDCQLLETLGSYGIEDKLLDCISSFLMGRKQQVILEGSCSSWAEVVIGVPHGSVLGPLLFLIYVNDWPDAIRGEVKLTAGDIKIYRSVSSFDDAAFLQSDLRT